jgi:hypothetical protein
VADDRLAVDPSGDGGLDDDEIDEVLKDDESLFDAALDVHR